MCPVQTVTHVSGRSFISLHLFLSLTPNHRLTPIELIHSELFNPGRTIFNCIALLIANHVRIKAGSVGRPLICCSAPFGKYR